MRNPDWLPVDQFRGGNGVAVRAELNGDPLSSPSRPLVPLAVVSHAHAKPFSSRKLLAPDLVSLKWL